MIYLLKILNDLWEIERLKHLKSIRKVLFNHQQDMKNLQSLNLTSIELVEKPNRYLVSIDILKGLPIEKVITETKKYQLCRLHDASYGAMISVENLYKENFDNYNALYIEMPFLLKSCI